MSSRRSASVAFVAMLALVTFSLGAWVSSGGPGVGAHLRQVTLATASVAAGSPDSDPRASSEPPPTRPTGPGRSSPVPPSSAVPVVDATRIAALDEAAPPRAVRIASVDLEMPVVATGVTRDGQMALPQDPRRIGWYRFGALPGDARGSAVLGGHVDSSRFGVGPLARLASVRDGARISVTAADGDRLEYRVASVERITKAALPVDRIFDPEGPHRLVLVTCGGRFLRDAGGYEDNIVVIAVPQG